jgi:hemoglobin/transferrin/lactoferrin receptor protein
MIRPLLFNLALTVPPLLAQNFLDPLVVTASRTEQAGSRAAYTTAYLDANFIRDNSRRTLPETLQYTPGVLVQKTTHGHGSPFIRGFTGRQNLLLVDGIRINNSTYRSGPVQYWNTLDPLALDHVELIKSQGSVLYGSDAAGGTLNAFTKAAKFREAAADHPFFGGAASYEYRSNGQGSHIGRLETETGIGGKFGILLGVSAKDYGDIESSAIGRMRGTGYTEKDFDVRLDWAVTADSTLTFAHNAINQDGISRWHRTVNNPGWKDGTHVTTRGLWKADDYDQARSLSYLRYAGEAPQANASIQRWSATASYQATADSEFQNRLGDPAAGSRPIRRSNIDVKTTGLDLLLESNIGPGSLVYGLDFYHDAVDSSGYQTNLKNSNRRESLPIADDSSYDLYGAYAQYGWKPIEKFELTGGGRYTVADASLGRFSNAAGVSQPSQSQRWDAAVGSLRGTYSLTPAWSLYGGVSQAFRAPNLDDLSSNLTSKSGVAALGSVNVEPEKFITYEIGTRHTTETTALNLAVFYAQSENLIVQTPVSAKANAATIATNAADGFTYGVELEGAWRFHPQWTLSGFAAWQEGRTSSETFAGSRITIERPNLRQLPLSGSLALKWTDRSEKFWIEARVLASNQEDRVSLAEQRQDSQRIPSGGTPGYVVTTLNAGWQVNPNLALHAGIENLTDEDYRNHGSGQNEAGLGGIFGVKLSW